MAIISTQKIGLGSSDEHLSPHFTVGDLTKSETAQKLGISNYPDTTEAYNNLKKLAALYEVIWSRIGPFTTLSSYRNQAVQNALKAGAAGAESAKMAATASYHTLGIAGDITPTTMKLEEFYTRLWNDAEVKKIIGQVAYKPTQNAVHISFQTDKFPQATPMKVLSDGSYVRLDEEEKEAWLVRYPIQIGVGIGVVILASLATFLLVKALRENPALKKAIAARAAHTAESVKTLVSRPQEA